MASSNAPSSTTTDARARARQMQVEQQRKDRRRRSFTIWGTVLAVAAIAALVIAFVATRGDQGIPTAGPAPSVANEEGGVLLTSPTEIAPGAGEREVDAASVDVPAEPAAAQPQSIPATGEPAAGEPAHIVVYADFNCVHCSEFERTNAEQLNTWLGEGKATVEYRMVDFLSQPGNQNYSARSANAAYCVAQESPESYDDFATGLFAAFEGHQGKGLSDDELTQRAQAAGADVADCIDDDTYRPAVEYATNKAKAAGVGGTPAVFVNGKNWAIDGAEQSFQDWARPMVEG